MLGIEFVNWYQVIRPIGFTVNEKSRVELLKEPDESDLLLRDKVPWILNKMGQDSMIRVREMQELVSSDNSPNIEPNSEFPAADSSMNLQETTYKLENIQDQDKEIEDIFWELFKSAKPKCPDDIDLQAVRKVLDDRRAKLGRQTKEPTDENLFEKYGLGLCNRRKPQESSDKLLRPRNELFELIEKMTTERMKPVTQRNDIYDKNKPIQGKVGFRRDETGHDPKKYTDLDEVLSFGDLDEDINLKKYLVQQKRGKYDSRGNFVSGRYDSNGHFIPGIYDSKGNFTAGKYDPNGNFIPGIYDEEGNFIPGIYDELTGNFVPGKFDSQGIFIKGNFNEVDDPDDDVRGEGKQKNKKKGTRKKGDTESESRSGKNQKSCTNMTETERQKYLENLRKAQRHPEVDFPLCNYPKWVHRMYRMDQVKIGQLIKQGMDVPRYTPPWMLDTLDRVWGNKNPKSRGEKPSTGTKQAGYSANKGITAGVGRDSGVAKRESQKRPKVENPQGRGGGIDGTGVGEDTKRGANLTDKEGLSGLADFLRGYEKDMVDLARLEARTGSDTETNELKMGRETSFDMDDLIKQYQHELMGEENIYKQDRDRLHMNSIMDERVRKMKERQDAALKRIYDKEKKIKQEDEIKNREKAEKDLLLNEKQRKKDHQLGTGVHDHAIGYSKSTGKKGKIWDLLTGKKTVDTGPCAVFKTLNQTRDDECRRRFQSLLSGKKSRFQGGTDFQELAKRIKLFKFPPARPRKTPCERVELPICR